MNVSEQQSEPVSGQAGAETAAKSEPVAAAAGAEAVRLAPEQEETSPKADAPRIDAPKPEAPKVEPSRLDPMVEAKIDAKINPKIDPTNMDVPKVETGKREEPRFPGKLMIMAPGDRTWDHEATASKPGAEQTAKPAGSRRFGAMAAVIALATVAGAIGGALATAGLGHLAAPAAASVRDVAAKDAATDAAAKEAADAALARIESEIAALKASVEQTAKAGQAQFSKASDRIEKVEKAQAEPIAKLNKLSETVDKLRAPTTTVAAVTPAREVTGSIPPATAAAAPAAPRPEVGRMPVVDGWALRDVGNGGALIEGRGGIYEVYAGDPVPGLGRVDAIRKQDGRWVVVTSKGLIVSR
ncbi:hypothetical protein [Bradyrhizobium sp. CCBAU 53421]|uniref:hypothetical protein n=1 Tax=Bradyrhizobium sp. CCBAU 53421 TaxID=1325120 RepID=UPI00188CA162|nr:hypothetical protein [Bradyrhizobium sp. CCBAU 53421]QOZ32197.1 hypothetical protein XH92_11210 [Bradyrhizobium sp. CCBAU 53421]